MKIKKQLISFTAVGIVIVGLVVAAFMLLADTTLKDAAKNCDTISITAEYSVSQPVEGSGNPVRHILNAVQTVNYKNRTGQTLDEIKFHIYANAYKDGAKNPPVTPEDVPQAYPNGKNFGGITVHSTAAENNSVIPKIEDDDDTVLSVRLAKSLKPGKSVRIDINYSVQLANIKHRLGWTDDVVNLGNFYPVPCVFESGVWQTNPYNANGDPFYNALHNFNVSITVPRDLTVASSGTFVKETTQANNKTLKMRSSAIRDFALVLSRKFKTISKTAGKTAIKYYYLDDSQPRLSLETAVKSVKTFSKLFTKYPYGQLSVVQTDFLHGGMEYGELVYISRDILARKENENETSQQRADHDRVIVHEIAHQWWYGLVGNNQTRSAWIDEGLAEYSTLLFYDHNAEYCVDRSQVIENARKNYAAYIKIVRGVGGELDQNMNRPLDNFNSSYEYVFMTYTRGLLLFCDLEMILTRNVLTRALGDFANSARFSIATQKRLVDSIEKSTQTKVGLFFESYLNGGL